jgi:hypothetical protein
LSRCLVVSLLGALRAPYKTRLLYSRPNNLRTLLSIALQLRLLVQPSPHFKFQGDNYPFGVPRKETTKKLRLLKSFGMFGGTMVYIDYTDHRSNIDVYTYDQLGFGFQLGQ